MWGSRCPSSTTRWARCVSSGRPSRCRARRPQCKPRRPTSASTPTRSWPSSASPPRTSPGSAGTRRSRAMAERFSPAEVADLLESAAAAIRAEVVALPKAAHVWHPEPDEWSINEIVGHLIEAERRGFAGRIKILLASKDPQLEGWDQNEVAQGRRHHLKAAANLD